MRIFNRIYTGFPSYYYHFNWYIMISDNTKYQLAGLFIAIPILTSLIVRHLYGTDEEGRATGMGPIDRLSRSLSISQAEYQVVEDRTPTAALEHKRQTAGLDNWNNLGLERPMVIVMVGLPARGKSYLVKMIQRYLNWTGYECEVFNVGSYRRDKGLAGADANFFSTTNMSAGKLREEMAMAVQNSMYDWVNSEVSGDNVVPINSSSVYEKKKVAIFDATNTTKKRRALLIQRAQEENVSLLFVESICDDEEVLKRNYLLKLKNDDYKGMDPATALADFSSRVAQYEKVYETIEDTENQGAISYIKLINVGQKLITRNCSGFLASQIAFHLQNVHIQPRRIYLTLTAENGKRAGLHGVNSVKYFDAAGMGVAGADQQTLQRDLTGTGAASLRAYNGDGWDVGSNGSDMVVHDDFVKNISDSDLSTTALLAEDLNSSAINNIATRTRRSISNPVTPLPGALLSINIPSASKSKPKSQQLGASPSNNSSVRKTFPSAIPEVSGEEYEGQEIFDSEEGTTHKSEDNSVHTPNAYSYTDSMMSTRGYQYAIDLTRYIKLEQDIESGLGSIDHYEDGSGDDVLVLAGTSDAHYETISHLRMHYPYFNTPLLDELRGGDFHGMSVTEIKERFPAEYAKRLENKLSYRYPGVGGESYLDVIERVKPIIIELERQRRSVVVVCHLAVFRCIHAYFMGTPVNEIPYGEFKKHTVYVLSPGPLGCTCRAVDPSTET